MQFTLRGMTRGQSRSTADDRVDAAAAIARYFNADVEGLGATVRLPISTASADDPLVAALLALGNSAMYDLTAAVGAGRWDEIVVELPPGELPLFRTRVDGAWGAWHPSPHSDRTLELFRILLKEADPGAGYDVVVRPREMIVCRWPHRASDARDAFFADVHEEPSGDARPGTEKAKRWGRRR
jgi:hypothetical protein